MAYERLTVVGTIGKVQVLVSDAQNRYAKVHIAVDRVSDAGKETVWYKVLLFGNMAKNEAMMAHYVNGRQILVEGRPQYEPYINGQGKPAVDVSIIASSTPELLGKKPS